MKGLWCDAVQLQITSISCTFDPNYDQQAQHDDTNGSQSQKHRSFSSILSNTRFTMGVRGSFGGVPLVEKCCSRSLCQSRSEERRVGKECRLRLAVDQY